MSLAGERLRKMDVLARLRKMERDEKIFRQWRCESACAEAAAGFSVQRQHYLSAQKSNVLNPDTHAWRLSAIEALRRQAQEAGDVLSQARHSLHQARQALRQKELEKKVADKAQETAWSVVERDRHEKELAEACDLHVFRQQQAEGLS